MTTARPAATGLREASREDRKSTPRWKLSAKDVIVRIVTYVLLLAVGVTTVGPFVIMTSVSFTQNIRFIIFPVHLIPKPITLENFQTLFSKTMAFRWLLNSVYVATVATLGAIITSTMAGYALSTRTRR
jgi:multiple sugar transport system permease protein